MRMQCDWKLAIATVIASVSLIVFSPIDSPNRILDAIEKRTYKKITVIFVRKVHLYNLFFCWDITDGGFASTLRCEKMCKLTKNRH